MIEANVWEYALGSVFIISLMSFIGALTLGLNQKKLKKILLFLVSFSGGVLLGDAFLHLIPEAISNSGLTSQISLYILSGIMIFFVIEKFIHWHHCHSPTEKKTASPFAYMSLIGDSIHNFIDGLLIGASYLVNIPLGIATTIAIIAHEIPQEIGDFSVLLHGGFTFKKALKMNFLVSLTAIIGTIFALFLGQIIPSINNFLIPFAAGGFVYIAASDLIPELKKENKSKESFLQVAMFLLGIAIMYGLLFLG